MVSIPLSARAVNNEIAFLRLTNVELLHVGQAFRFSRHPINFYMNVDMPSSYVKECAIHDTFNRAINIRASNYITFESNVVHNIAGSGFFLELGFEIGNTFKNNLVMKLKPSTMLYNDDLQSGF